MMAGIKRLAARALEQTAEVLDRTRERVEEKMTTRPPDDLVPGSWGGDAKGFDKLGDTLAVGYREGQAQAAGQIELAHRQRQKLAQLEEQAAQGDEAAEAKLQRIAQLAREKAMRDAKRPKPQYIKPNTDTGMGLVEGWAEEGVRNQAIAKAQTVQADAATARRISGQTKGGAAPVMSNIIAHNEPVAQSQGQVPPGLQAPSGAEPPPSRIALKRRPASHRAANAVATIGMIRHDVEEGQIDVGVMLDMLEVVSELQYALATELKAKARG